MFRCSTFALVLTSLAAVFAVPAPTLLAQDDFETVAISRTKFPWNRVNLRMGSFGAPGINRQGAVVFLGTAYGPNLNAGNNGYVGWIAPNRRNGRVVIQESARLRLPNGDVATLTELSTNPHINDKFISIWTGVFSVVELDGDQQTVTNNSFIYTTTRRGSYGQLAFYPDQTVENPEIDWNDRNTMSNIAGDLTRPDSPLSIFRRTLRLRDPIVAEGETAIGAPIGAEFTQFGFPTIANDGNVFFPAFISETDNQLDGIWAGKTGDPTPVVLIGQTATGTERFATFSEPAVPSPSGRLLAVTATTDGASEPSVWRIQVGTGQIRLVARGGQTISAGRGTLTDIQPAAINSSGQVAFGAKNTDASRASQDIERVGAIYFGSAPTNIRKVVAVGDRVTIRGVQRTVIDLRFGPTRGLNDRGEIAFTASFSDRTSGVFVARPGKRQ